MHVLHGFVHFYMELNIIMYSCMHKLNLIIVVVLYFKKRRIETVNALEVRNGKRHIYVQFTELHDIFFVFIELFKLKL